MDKQKIEDLYKIVHDIAIYGDLETALKALNDLKKLKQRAVGRGRESERIHIAVAIGGLKAVIKQRIHMERAK